MDPAIRAIRSRLSCGSTRGLPKSIRREIRAGNFRFAAGHDDVVMYNAPHIATIEPSYVFLIPDLLVKDFYEN